MLGGRKAHRRRWVERKAAMRGEVIGSDGLVAIAKISTWIIQTKWGEDGLACTGGLDRAAGDKTTGVVSMTPGS